MVVIERSIADRGEEFTRSEQKSCDRQRLESTHKPEAGEGASFEGAFMLDVVGVAPRSTEHSAGVDAAAALASQDSRLGRATT